MNRLAILAERVDECRQTREESGPAHAGPHPIAELPRAVAVGVDHDTVAVR